MVKVFKNSLLNVRCEKDGTVFVFKQEDGTEKEIKLNESTERIRNRYQDILTGARDTIYCSYGVVGDVNITFSENTVEFFDSPWMITFSREDFEKMLAGQDDSLLYKHVRNLSDEQLHEFLRDIYKYGYSDKAEGMDNYPEEAIINSINYFYPNEKVADK